MGLFESSFIENNNDSVSYKCTKYNTGDFLTYQDHFSSTQENNQINNNGVIEPDSLQYEQYKSVVESGELSLDALSRIIRHDNSHKEFFNSPGGLARVLVYEDCKNGTITPAKFYDEEGDILFGVQWPLPLSFAPRAST